MKTEMIKQRAPRECGTSHGRDWRIAAGIALGLPLAFALALGGCGSSENASNMTSFSANATKSETPGLFTIPQEQMAHVQVAEVKPQTLSRTLRLTGAVAYNAFHTTPVISEVGGPVSRVLVVPGEHVHAGQALLTISSPDYSQMRAVYLKARDAFHLADENYTRAEDLYAHNAIAQRDLLQAESDRSQAQADLDAAEQGLKILGITNPADLEKMKSTAEVPLLAPIAGEVVERDVAPGQLLAPGTTQAFVISDMSTVWILANVYESDLAFVKVGDTVTVTTDSYPDIFHGKIAFDATAVDPTTRTLQARIVVDNVGEKLKNNMYCTATVAAGSIVKAIAVPDAAILRDDENQPFVYVESGTNQFGRRPVEIGQSQNGETQVTSGLAAGDRVVGDGSLFLQFANSFQH